MERTLTVDGSVGRPRVVAKRRILAETGVLVGLALVLALFGALIGPQFFRAANMELVARQTTAPQPPRPGHLPPAYCAALPTAC